MAKYLVNDAAVAHCRELIEKRQYVLDSDWGEVQPGAEVQVRVNPQNQHDVALVF